MANEDLVLAATLRPLASEIALMERNKIPVDGNYLTGLVQALRLMASMAERQESELRIARELLERAICSTANGRPQ